MQTQNAEHREWQADHADQIGSPSRDNHIKNPPQTWQRSPVLAEGWLRRKLGLIARRRGFAFGLLSFRLAPIVLALELLDSSREVHDFLLAREERMRSSTDIDGHEWISLPLNLDRLAGLDRRSRYVLSARRRVLENDGLIVGMDALFHDPHTCKKVDVSTARSLYVVATV